MKYSFLQWCSVYIAGRHAHNRLLQLSDFYYSSFYSCALYFTCNFWNIFVWLKYMWNCCAVRSLGSVALRFGESMHHNFHFNFFAIDYNEVIRTPCFKKVMTPWFFKNNSVKNELILMIFGAQNSKEKTLKTIINVSTSPVPCEKLDILNIT